MNNPRSLKEFQNRLPDDIIIVDGTNVDFTEDEYVVILSWLKSFNKHYMKYEKNENFPIVYAIVSTRLRLDFGVYRFPIEEGDYKGKHIIGILRNDKQLNGKLNQSWLKVKHIVNTYKL